MAFPLIELVFSNNGLFLPFFSLFILLLASVLCLHNRFLGQKSKLPPSPPKLPIIGNLHQLGQVPHHSLKSLTDKYGPVLYLKLGQVPAIVVSSPDIIREIVKSNDAIFSSRPKTLASHILLYGGNNIGISPYGEFWRKARRVCVVNLLSVKRVQSFQQVREQEIGVIIDRVRKACLVNNGAPINLSQILIEASNNILSRCILGKSYRNEDGSVNKIGELANKLTLQLLSFSVGDFFPCLKWVDLVSGLVGRLRSTSRELMALLDRILQEHEASGGINESDAEDFVDVLLRIQRDSNYDFELTPNKFKAIIQDMFVAGMDTTSTVTVWIMAEFLKNPLAMMKAQEEVRRIVAEKNKIDMNDMDRMVYLKNVVKETLRLHPPAPLLVPRETTSTAKIGPYEIPAKTRVFVNAWAIQRDPSQWDNPEEFIPERFEKNPMDYFNGEDFRYIPFGFGRRRCPGVAFGAFTIEYAIANLLFWFDWKYPEESGSAENMDMSEVCGIVVHKKVSLRVVPREFLPLQH